MGSIWEIAGAGERRRGTPDGDTSCDVAIIGAGITGLTAALRLAEAGQRVIVLEAGRIGENNSGRSTGNLYGTLSRGLTPIASKWGEAVAREIAQVRAQAVDFVETTIGRYDIDCGFQRGPLYFTAETADDERIVARRLICDARAVALRQPWGGYSRHQESVKSVDRTTPSPPRNLTRKVV